MTVRVATPEGYEPDAAVMAEAARVGAEPSSRIFQMTPGQVQEVLRRARDQYDTRSRPTYERGDEAASGPVTFRVKQGNVNLQIHGLFVAAPRPGASPTHDAVEVLDRRWLWRRIFIEASYNVPLSSGERQIEGDRYV